MTAAPPPKKGSEPATPGEFGTDHEDLAIFLFFRILYLVPPMVWVLGLLVTVTLWVLVAPWLGGAALAALVVGVFAWSFIRFRRRRQAEAINDPGPA